MKLSARKTMVALGTAAALSLTGVSAPAMAADKAPAAKTTQEAPKEGDALYTQKWTQIHIDYEAATTRLGELDGIATKKAGDAEVKNDKSAASSLKDAQRKLADARFALTKVAIELPKYGKTNSPEYGELKASESVLAEVKRDLDDASSSLGKASPLKCDGKAEATDDSGSSSGLDFGSITSALGSSGQMKVTKDGTTKCVSRIDYYADKLKSIVSILTVAFTVITTVTKISETLQKQLMPKK